MKQGIHENLPQFLLLILVNALVGSMVGLERAILPAIAEQEFELAARAAVLSFIIVFGLSKALTNYVAGRFADRWGRKVVLVAGWLVALPVPFLLMWAPSWEWVVATNVLLGVSQGLTWSATVIMKIDLAGPEQRGLAMGLNEFAGYLAVGLSALATGYIATRWSLRPEPFYLGVGFAVLGTLLSVVWVRETQEHVQLEAEAHALDVTDADPDAVLTAPAGPLAGSQTGRICKIYLRPGSSRANHLEPRRPHRHLRRQHLATLTQSQVFTQTSFTDPDLSSVSQAGLVNNLNDGMAWGLFPLVYATSGMDLSQIGVLAAVYPMVWGLGQLGTGAASDRFGRKGFIVLGMWIQAVGIGLVAATATLELGFAGFAAASVLLGAGTAMVYPTLLAAIGDVAHPTWRASAVGVYRLWRDSGYAFGAILAGVVADAFGLEAAVWSIAVLTLISGTVVLVRMRETLQDTHHT